jgi:hypothetical protein
MLAAIVIATSVVHIPPVTRSAPVSPAALVTGAS